MDSLLWDVLDPVYLLALPEIVLCLLLCRHSGRNQANPRPRLAHPLWRPPAAFPAPANRETCSLFHVVVEETPGDWIELHIPDKIPVHFPEGGVFPLFFPGQPSRHFLPSEMAVSAASRDRPSRPVNIH